MLSPTTQNKIFLTVDNSMNELPPLRNVFRRTVVSYFPRLAAEQCVNLTQATGSVVLPAAGGSADAASVLLFARNCIFFQRFAHPDEKNSH
jgi:hypothetical protein